MRLADARTQWPLAIVPFLIAIPFALFISRTPPSTSVVVVAGVVPLLLAFMSPLTGLYVLVFSMLLGPEFLVGGLGSGTTLGRGITLRFDDLLLMLVGLGWMARTAISEHERIFVRTPLNRSIMLYVAACVLATLIGILVGRVKPAGGLFFLLKYYEYFFLYFMTVNLIKDEQQMRHLVTASLITCLAVSLFAISQIPSGVRVSAPFEGQDGEPNTLGGYLVFMMAIISGLLVTSGALARKWPLIALLGIAGVALQATLSRASFLAAGVVIGGVLIVVRKRSPLLVSLVLIGIIAVPLLAPRAVVDRMMYTFTQPQEEGQLKVGKLRVDTSTTERLRSWQHSVDAWLKSPLWGLGVTGGPFMDAMYPRVLTETGILGVCAFVALLWTIFRTYLKGYHEAPDPYMRGLTVGFILGFLALLVHGVGSNTFIIVRIMEPFWLYAGILVKSMMMNRATEHHHEKLQQKADGYITARPAPLEFPGSDSSRAGAA